MDTDNRPSFGRRGALIGAAGLATAGLAGSGSAPTAQAHDTRRRPYPGRVHSGLARLADHGYRELAGQKVGILTNPTGVFDDLRHEVDVLHADPRVTVTAVFGPEHGFRGTAQANSSAGTVVDDKTGLTVYDTFELSGQPFADVLQPSGVDTVLFDIADVGARFYTYIWTLFDTMEAAVLAGKRVVVLDRPNPLGGRRALGPVMHAPYETFVGRAPIYSGENCVGIDVAVTDWRAVDAVAYGVALLLALRHLYPDEFEWRNEGTEADPQFWIDNLTGSPLVRDGVDAGHPVERIVASWTAELHRFAAVRRHYLCY